MLGDGRETGFVGGVPGALVGHEHRIDDPVDFGVGGQGLQRGDGVLGAVERGDAHGHAALGGGVDRAVGMRLVRRGDWRPPCGGVHGDVGFAGEVEPDPAAVLEGGQGDGDLHDGGPARVGRVAGKLAGDGNAAAVDLGAIQVDAGDARQLDAQHDVVQRGPAAPVAGGEGVEVGLEADLVACGDGGFGARCGDDAGCVRLRFDEVQRPHVTRFARLGKQDPLQSFDCEASVLDVCAHGGHHGFRVDS